MVSAIVCVDNNWGIGKDGKLLLKIPEDMEFFRKVTSGSFCIMGRKTWDSMFGKPLSNRKNIVISNTLKVSNRDVLSCSMKEVKNFIKQYKNKEKIFVIGGAQIYSQLLKYCDEVYITKLFNEFEADIFFPNLDKEKVWETIELSEEKNFMGTKYKFYKYRRKNG